MKVRNTRKYNKIRFKGEVFEPKEVKEIDAKPDELIIGLREVKEKKDVKKERVKKEE
ncbi:MAG: hypothetical protein ACTSYJ_03315 [Candidatus Thorarchaeota archaeon]